VAAGLRRFARRRVAWLAWAGFLVLWQVVGSILNPIYLSTPTAVAAAAWRLIASGDLQAATLISVRSLIIGFLLALAAGIPVGILMGRNRLADYSLDVYVTSLYVTPTIALLPMVILWFGLDLEAKVMLVFLSTFFPIVLNVRQGAKDLSGTLAEVAAAFGLSWHARLTKITLWAIFPYIVAGLRLGIGRAVGTMLVAEMVTRTQGLGALLVAFSNSFRIDQLMVPVLVLVALGVGLTELLKLLERRVAPWHATQRSPA
jgi:ABC-type nitrate/sulfonate/bicarbonate transport system permease component